MRTMNMLNGFRSAHRNPPIVPWYRALKSVRISVQTRPAPTTQEGASRTRAGSPAPMWSDRVVVADREALTGGPSGTHAVSADAVVVAEGLRRNLPNFLTQPQCLAWVLRFDQRRQQLTCGHVGSIAFERRSEIIVRAARIALQHGYRPEAGRGNRRLRVEILKSVERIGRFLQPPQFDKARAELAVGKLFSRS